MTTMRMVESGIRNRHAGLDPASIARDSEHKSLSARTRGDGFRLKAGMTRRDLDEPFGDATSY